MTKIAERVLSEAMSLDATERAELAAKLLDTLDPSTDTDYLAAWDDELKLRLQELDESAVKPIAWTEARRLIQNGTDAETC